jgi:hypothetical protein
MFEDYIITHHSIERYAERANYNKKNIIRQIKYDLRFTNAKRIINHENTRYIFTYNNKEFIFKKDKDTWILKTVIKRSRERTESAIEKRLQECV